eukprot:10393100-Alexandrium_andersonii.AAC.1
MSASLVGSEMCIRDSFVAMQPRTAPAACLWPALVMLNSHRHGAVDGQRCLLYTSDAADDM